MQTALTIIIATILFLIVLNIELYVDERNRRKGIDTKHKSKPLRRFALLLPSMVGYSMPLPIEWYFAFPFIVMPMVGFAWWFLFDGLRNLIAGQEWWYNGSPILKEDDSDLDIFLRKLSDGQELMIKVIPILLFVAVYILTINEVIL
jgi:hypothetical protein